MKKLLIFVLAIIASSTILVYGFGLTGAPLYIASAVVGVFLGLVL